jgi:hypothetical protein
MTNIILTRTIRTITNDMNEEGGDLPPMDIYMAELRITADEEETLETESIRPGSKSICHASVQLQVGRRGTESKTIKAKLDSCGSVSIAHGNLLNAINQQGSVNYQTLDLWMKMSCE